MAKRRRTKKRSTGGTAPQLLLKLAVIVAAVVWLSTLIWQELPGEEVPEGPGTSQTTPYEPVS